jgi:hypothetical protein
MAHHKKTEAFTSWFPPYTLLTKETQLPRRIPKLETLVAADQLIEILLSFMINGWLFHRASGK